MYSTEFTYQAPTTLADAIKLLQSSGDGAKVLAGGQSLLPLMKLRLAEPPALIDLGRIPELRGVREDGADVVLGATTTYVELITNPTVQAKLPLLVETICQVGDPQVRARGTIGGSLAHADPAGDVPAAVIALDGQITATGPNGERTIAARDFFVDLLTTALQPGEVLTSIRLPAANQASTGFSYMKHRHPASGYAVVGAAALVRLGDDGTCQAAQCAITGAGNHATRQTAVEQAITGKALDDATLAAAAHAADGLEQSLMSDSYASGEFRVHLAQVLTRRALAAAAARAKGGA